MLGTHYPTLPSTSGYCDYVSSVTRSHDPYLVEELLSTSMVAIISDYNDVV